MNQETKASETKHFINNLENIVLHNLYTNMCDDKKLQQIYKLVDPALKQKCRHQKVQSQKNNMKKLKKKFKLEEQTQGTVFNI